MLWAGHERPSRSGLGSLSGSPGANAQRPTTSGNDCPERPGERRPMPLIGRTTVTLDLKGCLEEVSRIAAGAGTQPQRHDHQKEPAANGSRERATQRCYPAPASHGQTKDHGSDCSKKGKVTRSQRLGDLSLKLLQLFSTRGQNINQAFAANSGDKSCSTLPVPTR